MGFEQGIAEVLLHYGVKVELSPAGAESGPDLLVFDNGRARAYDIKSARRLPCLHAPAESVRAWKRHRQER